MAVMVSGVRFCPISFRAEAASRRSNFYLALAAGDIFGFVLIPVAGTDQILPIVQTAIGLHTLTLMELRQLPRLIGCHISKQSPNACGDQRGKRPELLVLWKMVQGELFSGKIITAPFFTVMPL